MSITTKGRMSVRLSRRRLWYMATTSLRSPISSLAAMAKGRAPGSEQSTASSALRSLRRSSTAADTKVTTGISTAITNSDGSHKERLLRHVALAVEPIR